MSEVEQVEQRLRALSEIGRYQELITAARRALTGAPEADRLWTWLAYGLRRLGQQQAALAAAERACGLGTDFWPQVIRSQCLGALHRHADSFAAAQRAVELAPGQAFTLLRLARVARRVGELEQGWAAAERARGLEPDNPDVWETLGYLATEEQDWRRAEGYYRAAVERVPGGVYYLEALADAVAEQGRHAEAIEHYRRALSGDPRRPSIHRKLALTLLDLDRADEGIAVLERAVAAFPREVSVRGSLTYLRYASGRVTQALATARAATEELPDDHEAWCLLAWYSAAVDELDTALAAAERGVELAPTSAYALRVLGDVLSHCGRHHESLELARRATAAHPGRVDCWHEVAHNARAAGCDEEAEQAARHAITIARGDGRGWGQLLICLVVAGERDRARAVVAELAAALPDQPSTWENVAWAALHLRDRAWIERARAALLGLVERGRARPNPALLHELDAYLALLTEDWPAAEAAAAAAIEAGATGCTNPCLLALARARRGDPELGRRVLARERFGPRRAVRCVDPRCADVAALNAALSSLDAAALGPRGS